MTLDCIRSVFEQTKATDFEVIVVDNASTDGSADAIEQDFSAVRLIRSETNLGFAPANNVAAAASNADLLLLLNPDTLILDGAIDRLVAFARSEPRAGIWGGRTLFGDRSLDPTSCWRFANVWSVFAETAGLVAAFPRSALLNREAYGGWLRDNVREVDIVTGCFLLVSADLWRRLDGFDERFFMYGEEADLCFRARILGARPLLCPEATIVHYGGASDTVRSSKLSKLFAGKVTFMMKHWSRPNRWLGLQLLKLKVLSRASLNSVLSLIKPSRRSIATEWWAVWYRRVEWQSGYPEHPKTDRNVRLPAGIRTWAPP
jgi:GT2 family glycosyltransferase